MCGIAGLVRTDPGRPVDDAKLREACEALRHRGPDGSSIWSEPGLGLAHARLAIIDPMHGEQPMFTPDRRHAVVFNGEIYNHHDLRRELEKEGVRFRTRCDTEVLPHLYARDGPAMVSRLRGMFAIAVLDRTTRSLFLARDRYGEKPLYYLDRSADFAFASTVDALVRLAHLAPEIEPQALLAYLVLQYVPGSLSPLRGVRKLPPGHRALWRAGRLELERYWRPPTRAGSANPGPPSEQALSRLRGAIAEAVTTRLESDVPLGVFLSGGLDSSVVLAEASEAGFELDTFSVGFREKSLDESRSARLVASRFGGTHTELEADSDVGALFDLLCTEYDEPFADSSALPTLAVAKAAKPHVTVVLTGDGGDELFGGYVRYQRFRRARLWARLVPVAGAAGRWLESVADAVGTRRMAAVGRLLGDPWVGYRDALFHFHPAEAAALLRRELVEQLEPQTPIHGLDALWAERPGDPSDLLWLDQQTYLPDDLLTKMDRATMACGLEARAPFLDHTLAEIVAGHPDAWLFRGGRGKEILRRAYRGLLPEAILARRKMGFGVPVAAWLRDELRSRVETLLLSPRSVVWNWLHFETASPLVRRFLSGDDAVKYKIWNLLALAGWARVRFRAS